MESYSAIKKEHNYAICSNMDGLGGYYAKLNNSDRERKILYINYMWNLKKIQQASEYNKKAVELQIQRIVQWLWGWGQYVEWAMGGTNYQV